MFRDNALPEDRRESAAWRWAWRALLLVFAACAVGGWIQENRTRILRPEVPITISEWNRPGPVRYVRGEPGKWHRELARMPGRNHVSPDCIPTLDVRIPFRRAGYILHICIADSDHSPANLDIAANGATLASHKVDRRSRFDVVEVDIPARALAKEGDSTLTVRNTGEGAWVGRLVLIPYGIIRRPLQVALPVSGFLLLLLGAWRQCGQRRPRSALWFGVVFFFIYFHTLLTAKVAPLANIAFSDSDELVHPFLTHVMDYDLTKHMLCLSAIHFLWWVFRLVGWAEMTALAGAFSLVAALNVAVARLVFARLTRDALGGALLTLCYAASFAVWLYSSIYETFIFSTLMTNLFLIVWLRSRTAFSWRRSAVQCGLVVLCALAHPPLIVLFGAVIHQWIRMWRRRRVAVTVLGVVALTALTCGGFLGGRFLMRRAYITKTQELATASVVDECADVGKMISPYASLKNLTWSNAGNMVLGQCVYAMGGTRPEFEWRAGWKGGWRYLKRPSGWLTAGAVVALWALACAGVLMRRGVLIETLSLAALVMLPHMLFYYWFNPREMLLYAPPMMAVMLGWQAWAGRPIAPRLFDAVVALTACIVVAVNTEALLAFR
jgi:hypothetical protein